MLLEENELKWDLAFAQSDLRQERGSSQVVLMSSESPWTMAPSEGSRDLKETLPGLVIGSWQNLSWGSLNRPTFIWKNEGGEFSSWFQVGSMYVPGGGAHKVWGRQDGIMRG